MARTLLPGFLGLFFLGALSACGGIAVFDDGAGGDAATGVTTGATSITSSTRASSAATGGPASIAATIDGISFTANCKPLVGDDPVSGSVDVRYFNAGNGAGSINILNAQISFANPMEGWVFPILLSPTSSGQVIPGSPSIVTHQKIAAIGDASMVCSLCGLPGTVSISYDNGSQIGGAFTLVCAF